MAGGFIIFAGSLAALGYPIAALILRPAHKDVTGTWPAFLDDPRPAQLLNPRLGGSVNRDHRNGWGASELSGGPGYADRSDIAHRKIVNNR